MEALEEARVIALHDYEVIGRNTLVGKGIKLSRERFSCTPLTYEEQAMLFDIVSAGEAEDLPIEADELHRVAVDTLWVAEVQDWSQLKAEAVPRILTRAREVLSARKTMAEEVSNVPEFVRSGAVRWVGRDAKLRPVLVANMNAIVRLDEKFYQAVDYCMEYARATFCKQTHSLQTSSCSRSRPGGAGGSCREHDWLPCPLADLFFTQGRSCEHRQTLPFPCF